MPVEMLTDIINFESLVGEGTGQLMVGGDIMLGDRSPEILNILSVDGNVHINSSECIDDNVVLDGKMEFDLLYASHSGNACLYKVNALSSFTHSIHIEGAKANVPCKVNTRIDHINVEQLSNRKIKVNAIINIDGIVYMKSTIEAVTDIKAGEVQVLRNTVAIEELISENSAQAVLHSHFAMPSGVVNSILKKECFVYKKEIQFMFEKLSVSACARTKFLYDNVEGDVFWVEQDVPFSCEMEIKGLTQDMKVDTVFEIKDSYDEIKEDEQGVKNIIDGEMVIEVSCKTYGRKELENVVDAYSTQKRYEMVRESVKVMSYFGSGYDNENIRERIKIPEEITAVARIKNILVKPSITDVKAVDNKVIIEGLLNCSIIYIGVSKSSDEEVMLYNYDEEIVFKSSVEIPGVKIEMSVEAEINSYELMYEMISERNIDVKVLLSSEAKAYAKGICDISSNAVETELPDNFKRMPSIIIYTVQTNDSLWKIAKKYNTTIEDIIHINKFKEDEEPIVGSKILIPKKNLIK